MTKSEHEEQRLDTIKDGPQGWQGPGEDTDAGTPEGDIHKGRQGKVGFVYFIETEDHRYIKIGYSDCPLRRIGQLRVQVGAIFGPLHLVGYFPGNVATERWLHFRFAEYRYKGEWFASSDALRSFAYSVGLPSLIAPLPSPIPWVNRERYNAWRRALHPNSNPAAVSMGRRGGKAGGHKGGKARAAALTAEQRSAIARQGGFATARARATRKKKHP